MGQRISRSQSLRNFEMLSVEKGKHPPEISDDDDDEYMPLETSDDEANQLESEACGGACKRDQGQVQESHNAEDHGDDLQICASGTRESSSENYRDDCTSQCSLNVTPQASCAEASDLSSHNLNNNDRPPIRESNNGYQGDKSEKLGNAGEAMKRDFRRLTLPKTKSHELGADSRHSLRLAIDPRRPTKISYASENCAVNVPKTPGK